VWLQVDAEAIPLPDASVDAVTIVFGLRNVTHPANALKESRRILRRGGRYAPRTLRARARLVRACVVCACVVCARDVCARCVRARAHMRVRVRACRFLCMEFAEVRNPALRQLYDEYSLKLIPAIGAAVVGDAQPYQYLVESIRAFPKQEEVKAMMRAAGFKSVSHEDLVQGAVAIYSGFNL
jgi:ubiquinone/menaquinone biosynthesis C-methylase UbiE